MNGIDASVLQCLQAVMALICPIQRVLKLLDPRFEEEGQSIASLELDPARREPPTYFPTYGIVVSDGKPDKEAYSFPMMGLEGRGLLSYVPIKDFTWFLHFDLMRKDFGPMIYQLIVFRDADKEQVASALLSIFCGRSVKYAEVLAAGTGEEVYGRLSELGLRYNRSRNGFVTQALEADIVRMEKVGLEAMIRERFLHGGEEIDIVPPLTLIDAGALAQLMLPKEEVAKELGFGDPLDTLFAEAFQRKFCDYMDMNLRRLSVRYTKLLLERAESTKAEANPLHRALLFCGIEPEKICDLSLRIEGDSFTYVATSHPVCSEEHQSCEVCPGVFRIVPQWPPNTLRWAIRFSNGGLPHIRGIWVSPEATQEDLLQAANTVMTIIWGIFGSIELIDAVLEKPKAEAFVAKLQARPSSSSRQVMVAHPNLGMDDVMQIFGVGGVFSDNALTLLAQVHEPELFRGWFEDERPFNLWAQIPEAASILAYAL